MDIGKFSPNLISMFNNKIQLRHSTMQIKRNVSRNVNKIDANRKIALAKQFCVKQVTVQQTVKNVPFDKVNLTKNICRI